MSDKAAQRSVPRSPIAVIGVILGLLAAKNYPSDPAAGAANPPTANDSGAPIPTPAPPPPEPGAILRPLHEILFGEGAPQSPPNLADIKKRLTGPSPTTIDFLNVMVPDPVETSLSFRFDETVDSIERALQTRGYILERWRLPWSDPSPSPPGGETPGDALKAVAQLARAMALGTPTASPKFHPTPGDPGLLVFRRRSRAKPPVEGQATTPGIAGVDKLPGKPGGFPEFLLVFLITETPTQGIDRMALDKGLGLAEELRDASEVPPGDPGRETIHILGPYFSGSMPSLRDCLLDRLGPASPPPAVTAAGGRRAGEAKVPEAPSKPGGDRRLDSPSGYKIDVISGSASAFDKEGFEREFVVRGRPVDKVEFSSTMRRSETIKRAVLEFLGLPDGEGVAILTEGNTGFGKTVSSREGSKSGEASKLVSLQYPLHIAEIRERYESQGLLQDGAADVFRSAGELQGRRESRGKARDVFPDQTSEATAVAQNRVLTQTLRFLEDSRFKAIGIISTDPRDTVFLARLVRRYCPDARVFTVGSDLMFLDPVSISDLRGMIVGTTYPLYAPNQAWSGSDAMSTGRVFPSATAQGTYNAAILQLARMTDGEERKGLLEYASPLSLQPVATTLRGRPPVWISVVGERSLYPIGCRPRKPLGEDPVYVEEVNYVAASCQTPGQNECGPRLLKINRVSAWISCFGAISLILLFAPAHRIHGAYRKSKFRFPLDPSVMGVGEFIALSVMVLVEALATWHPPRAVPPDRSAKGLIEAFARNSISIVRGLIFSGYLYIACPILAFELGLVDLNLDKVVGRWFLSSALFLTFCLVLLATILAPIAECAVGRRSVAGARAEVGGLLVPLVVMFGGIMSMSLSGSAWWPLTLDRSAAITGGVSPYVPVMFLMIALGSWTYARGRIREINRRLGSREINRRLGLARSTARDATSRLAAPRGEVGRYKDIVVSIRCHLGDFESWFRGHPGLPLHAWRFVRREPWKAGWAWLAAIALLPATGTDVFLLRPLSRSDEGMLFDIVFRFGFIAVFFLFCVIFALVASAWHDLGAVLAGFAKFPGEVFDRIPKKVSTWFFDPASCRDEYRLLIDRQARAIRSLLDRRSAPRAYDGWATAREHAEACRDLPYLADGQAGGGLSPNANVGSIPDLALELATHWSGRPVAPVDRSPGEESPPKAAPTLDDEVLARKEELLALYATRWISGALGRIWTLIGFLVVSSLSLLFAITSYPFPEQPRVMTILGLGIAGLLVMILRVVIGSSRDEVISRVGDTTPGKVTWDAALFGHVGAFIVPLVGVLAAISFDALDLFRAVLGPILRLFP